MSGVFRSAVVCVILIGRLGHAQIGVSPPRFELDIDSKPATHSLRLFNYGEKQVTVSVSVHNWDLDENNEVRILSPTEQSLDQWIVLNPLHFTVEGGQTQTVRFAIRPKVQPARGEHRAIIYLQEVREDDDNTAFQVVFRLGVAVYGFVGDVTRTGILHGIRVNGNRAEIDVSSTGTAHIRFDGQYAVWGADEYPGPSKTRAIVNSGAEDTKPPQGVYYSDTIPTTPFLPGTRRTLSITFGEPLPEGRYFLDVNSDLGTAVVDTGIAFNVRARAPIPDDSPE